MIRTLIVFCFVALVISNAKAQTTTYTQGGLVVDVFRSNPCNGSNNGFIEFTVVSTSDNLPAQLQVIIGPPNLFTPQSIAVGGSYIFNPAKSLSAVNDYEFIIADNTGTDIINTFGSPISFTALPNLTLTDDPSTDLSNSDCSNPNGQIAATIGGGSKVLVGGGSFTYSWSTTNGLSGFPVNGTSNGTTVLDLASLAGRSGLPGGDYTLVVIDDYSQCSISKNWTITDPQPALQTITNGGPQIVCIGTSALIQLGGSEVGITYEVLVNGSPSGISQLGTGSPIIISVPSAAFSNGQVLVVRAVLGSCSPKIMNGFITMTVNPLPVPTLTGLTPVCAATTGVVYTTDAGQSNYTWSVSAGGTITAGGTLASNTVTVTWNTAGTQTVSVNYTNINGCIGAAPTTLNVTVNPLPVPTLTGPLALCVGTTGSVYTTEAGQSAYVWNVSPGGTVTSGGTGLDNTVTVTWGTAGPQSVSVNYNDANGCTAAAATSVGVTVSPLPVPTILGSTTVCAGSTGNIYTTEVGKTGYTWSVSGGGTITSGGGLTDNTVTITWNTAAAQTVSVTYTDPSGCSAAAATISNITVNPQPTPALTGSLVVCANTTGVVYTTDAGQSNYSWNISPGGTITSGGTALDNTATVTWSTAGPQTISVNYLNGFGCPAAIATTLNVTVNPLPVPTLTGSVTACVGATGVVYTTDAGQSNYVWTVSGGGLITAGGTTGSNTVTITWGTAGLQNVTVSYTDGNGCLPVTPTALGVTVSLLPVPTLTGSTPVCAGSTGNVYTTDAGQLNYVWFVSAGGTITAGGTNADNTVTVTWNTAGARLVQVNYSAPSGCTAAAPTTLNVAVDPLPTPTLTGVTSSCVGTTGVVYTTDASQSNYIWSVSPGGTITSGGTGTDNTVTVTWTTVGPQTVSVNYLNAFGCTATTPTQSNVTVNPLPVPTLSGLATACAGTTGVMYTTEVGQSNYIWVVSAGGTITAGGTLASNTVTVTWNTIGAQSVSISYTDPSGCVAASPTSLPVTVNPVPTPTLSGTTSLCVGTTGVTYTSDAGQSNYVWTVSPGGTITAGGTATDNTVTITWTTSGAQSVSVNYNNASGCPAPVATSLGVTVSPLPVPTLTGSLSVCVGATGVVYSTEAAQSGYIWTVSPGGTITSGGAATDNSVTVTWTTAGLQSVTVNYTDLNGCTAVAPASSTVTVNNLPVPTITGSLSVCTGSTGNVYTTEAGQSNYTWVVSPGGSITAGGSLTDNTVTVTWTTAGAQSVSVNYTNAAACTSILPASASVTVNSAPVPALAGSVALCIGTTGVVYTTDAGQLNYTWFVSGGGTITSGGSITDNTVTVTWSGAGAQTVTVNYTDASGCTAASPTSLPVVVNPLPIPTLSGSANICVGATGVVYTTDAAQTNYLWSVSPGGTITSGGSSTDNTVTVTWPTSGPQFVSVSYTDINGCIAATPTVLNVNVNATIVPTLTGSAAVCVGTTGVVYTTDAGQSNYIWIVSPGGTVTSGGALTDNTVTVTWGTSGPQSVSISYTDINGCPVPAPTLLNVAVGTIPTPTLTGSNAECIGATNVVYSTDIGQTNYTWTVSPGGTITAGGSLTDNTVTVTWTIAGAQTVTVNYTSSGCTAATPASLNVTVNPLPVPTLTGSATACVGATGVIYSTDAGQSNYNWIVTPGGTITAGGSPTDNTITITWTTAGAQSLSVNYTDANGCTALIATSQSVTVNPLPLPTITGSTVVCVGVAGVTYTTEAGQTNYTWIVSPGGTITAGGAITDNSVTVTWTTAGSESVSVNYSDGALCTAATATISAVTVNSAPSPTLSGITTVCSGTTNVIYSTEIGQSNYAWSVSAGGVITAGGAVTDNTVTITWITAGPQTVSVNYSSLGCSAPAPTSLPVTVNALPTATLTGNNTLCIGASSTLTFTLTGSGPWNVIYSDGTTNFPVVFATSPGTVSVSPIAPTTYSLVSVSNTQCGAGTTSGTAVITVNPIPGDQVTFGADTWLGYVYTDAGPPVTAPDFAASKYRGFIDETDISSLGFSSYTAATDAFNLNLSNFVPMAGPNVCGSFLERFSVRYKMTKTLPNGTYTFTVGADDGVRLLIDGVNVISPAAFGPHPYQVFTATVCILSGPHDFEIEYFEATGFSRLSFDYQLAPAPLAPTPVTVCVGSAAPALTVSSTDPSVLSFRWYTDAALTNLILGVTPPGSSYTPAPVELDMSVTGTTDFFVTAVYACGESQAAQVVVDVVNGATVTLPIPPVQICQTGGIVDLNNLVSALPGGGNFTFAGTGVTTSPNFDPTLVTGSTSILVDYTVGTCVAPQQTLVIDVINTATVTVPVVDIDICQSSGLQDLTLLVSATPLLGSYTFSGAGVTGTDFDPSAQSGIVPILVDYNVGGPGGCSDSKTFNFNVSTNAVLTVNNSTIVCPSAADVNLLSLVSAVPAGGNFVFTGSGVSGNFFDPSAFAGTTVSINITYDQGGCTALGTVQIVVRSAADPACSVVGSDCLAFNVLTSPLTTNPSCNSGSNDGVIALTVSGGTGGNLIVSILNGGIAVGPPQILPSGSLFIFNGLAPNLYQYRVFDGVNVCIQDFDLPVKNTVDATIDPLSLVDVQCFGQPTGKAKITAIGGSSPYEYSVDGINWISFVSGEVVTTLPPNGTYNVLVRDDAADLCPDEVSVTINNANPDLQIVTTITDATCNNNDGSILITPPVAPNIGGGGPYQYALNDGVNTTAFQDELIFDNLPGGVYSILVEDNIGCVKTITPVNVTFPGFVNFTYLSTPAGCANFGLSGSISVDVTDVGGIYKVALSTDQINEPAATEYLDYSEPSITFNNLAVGTYFIYVQSQTASCPTRSSAISVNGVNAVNFDITPLCDNNEVSLLFDNMTGSVSFGELRYELYVYDKLNPGVLVTPTGFPIPLDPIDANVASVRLDYNDARFAFLKTPGVEYLISLYQIEPNLGCDIFSPVKNYTTTRPVFARSDPSKTFESYDEMPTGKMSIIDFDGGFIPYKISITLDSAKGSTTYVGDGILELVEKNSNLEFQKDYINIPAGRYIVHVEDSIGCVVEFNERVPLDIDLFIPNIFTPNEGADNPVFYIRNLDLTNTNKLVIKDRWGLEVFSTNSYQNDWTGEGLSDGIYYYTLQTPSETKKGWVEILRGSKP